jgi:ATP-dependent RNA helicase RhlE
MLIKEATPISEIPYAPENSFESMALHPLVKKNIVAKGYTNPSPIQDKVINHVLDGKDVIGLANTGTGKTAAFVLPLLTKVLENQGQKVLIITPTRELAIQICDEGLYFSRGSRVYFSLIIGGASMGKQLGELRRHPEFVVGTPGRLKDLMERGALKLGEYQTIVLDEVDRMLDMGFVRDIRTLIGQLPKERHSLFFSATMSGEARVVANEFLNNPVVIEVSSQKASDNVNQDVIYLKGRNKMDVLHDILIQPGFDKVLIFGRTKHGMERLSSTLNERGFSTTAIHGNKTQSQRQKALQAFQKNHIKILLATDVASRGLDIDQVTHVINYELPETYEDYIHRIGRTGRAGHVGHALTLID